MNHVTAKRILVIDDDFDMRDAVRDLLEDEGHVVLLAADGREGLARLRDEATPDVVLLDWMMPGLDGRQFLLEVRSDPAWASLRIVLLTADPNAANEAIALGASASLRKPVRLEQLLDALLEK